MQKMGRVEGWVKVRPLKVKGGSNGLQIISSNVKQKIQKYRNPTKRVSKKTCKCKDEIKYEHMLSKRERYYIQEQDNFEGYCFITVKFCKISVLKSRLTNLIVLMYVCIVFKLGMVYSNHFSAFLYFSMSMKHII